MPAPRLSRSADEDIAGILTWSEENFGEAARDRYLALLRAAVEDVARRPGPCLSAPRPELGDGVRAWHIRNSRHGSGAGTVRRPRRVLFYRVAGDEVVIGRVLDQVMDPTLHVDDQAWQA